MARTRFPVDLAAGAAWTVLAVALALAQAPLLPMVPIGLPFVLLLPGYAVLSVTHPAAPPAAAAGGEGEDPPEEDPQARPLRSLSMRERFLLAVPLSVTVVTAVLLVANFTTLHIEAVPVVLALAAATLLAFGLGWAARAGGVPAERRPEFATPAPRRRPWHEWASLVLLVPAVGAALWAATVFGEEVRDDGYVSLFVEPNQRTDCYPLQADNGTFGYNRTSGRCTAAFRGMAVVVNNHAGKEIGYRLVVLWSAVPGPETALPGDTVVDETSGTLEPVEEGRGLERQLVVPLDPGPPPGPGLHYLKVHLHVDGEVEPSHALQLRVESR